MTRRAVCALLPWAAVPLWAAVLSGCVNLTYTRVRKDEPLPESAVQALRAGQDDLGVCLGALGAPNVVLDHRGGGMALLWYWQDAAGFGLEVSSPSDQVPASMSFDFGTADLPGCMLWFGPDLVLERWRFGAISDLLRGRVRPAMPSEG